VAVTQSPTTESLKPSKHLPNKPSLADAITRTALRRSGHDVSSDLNWRRQTSSSADEEVIVDAYMATARADDGLPADIAWVRQAMAETWGADMYHPHGVCATLQLVPPNDELKLNGWRLHLTLMTRRSFRQLCRSIGAPLKERLR
jgi:hypothetical protein